MEELDIQSLLPEYEMSCWALGLNTDKFLHPRMPV